MKRSILSLILILVTFAFTASGVSPPEKADFTPVIVQVSHVDNAQALTMHADLFVWEAPMIVNVSTNTDAGILDCYGNHMSFISDANPVRCPNDDNKGNKTDIADNQKTSDTIFESLHYRGATKQLIFYKLE